MKYTVSFKNAEGKGSQEIEAEIEAENDEEFWNQVEAMEDFWGYPHILNSAFCVTESRKVPESPKTVVPFKKLPTPEAAGFRHKGEPNARKKIALIDEDHLFPSH